MPRVSQEHANARRQQILDAARVAFIRDGFHATSMQDIQRESGLSAGAIYLYFRSKNEIIVAIAAGAMRSLADAFAAPPHETTPLDLDALIDGVLGTADRLQRELQVFPVIIQVWAEALRNPALLQDLRMMFNATMTDLTRQLIDYQAAGIIAPEVDPVALRMALVGLVQGYIVQSALLGEMLTLDQYRAGVYALLHARAAPVEPTPGG